MAIEHTSNINGERKKQKSQTEKESQVRRKFFCESFFLLPNNYRVMLLFNSIVCKWSFPLLLAFFHSLSLFRAHIALVCVWFASFWLEIEIKLTIYNKEQKHYFIELRWNFVLLFLILSFTLNREWKRPIQVRLLNTSSLILRWAKKIIFFCIWTVSVLAGLHRRSPCLLAFFLFHSIVGNLIFVCSNCILPKLHFWFFILFFPCYSSKSVVIFFRKWHVKSEQMNELEQGRFFRYLLMKITEFGTQQHQLANRSSIYTHWIMLFSYKNIEIFNNSRRKIRNQLIQLCSMHGQKEDI